MLFASSAITGSHGLGCGGASAAHEAVTVSSEQAQNQSAERVMVVLRSAAVEGGH
jgi:hypothetical protein